MSQGCRHFSAIKSRRAVLLVAAALLLQAVVYAQEIPRRNERKEESGEPSSPLEIRLSTPTPTLYAGSCLTLEMVLTNKGEEEIRIIEGELWKNYSYSYSAQDGSGKGGGEGSSCFGCSTEKVSLGSGMTYRSSHCFNLDNEFFRNAGEYQITTSVRYELPGKSDQGASSNSMRFEIY